MKRLIVNAFLMAALAASVASYGALAGSTGPAAGQFRLKSLPYFRERIRPILDLFDQFPDIAPAVRAIAEKPWVLSDEFDRACHYSPATNGRKGELQGCMTDKSVILNPKFFGPLNAKPDPKLVEKQIDIISHELSRGVCPSDCHVPEDSFFKLATFLVKRPAPSLDELQNELQEVGFGKLWTRSDYIFQAGMHELPDCNPFDAACLIPRNRRAIQVTLFASDNRVSKEQKDDFVRVVGGGLRRLGDDPGTIPPLSKADQEDLFRRSVFKKEGPIQVAMGDGMERNIRGEDGKTLDRSVMEGRHVVDPSHLAGTDKRIAKILNLLRSLPGAWEEFRGILKKTWAIDNKGLASCPFEKGASQRPDSCQDANQVILNPQLFAGKTPVAEPLIQRRTESIVKEMVFFMRHRSKIGRKVSEKQGQAIAKLLAQPSLPSSDELAKQLMANGMKEVIAFWPNQQKKFLEKITTRSSLMDQQFRELAQSCTQTDPGACLAAARGLVLYCNEGALSESCTNSCFMTAQVHLQYLRFDANDGPYPAAPDAEMCSQTAKMDQTLSAIAPGTPLLACTRQHPKNFLSYLPDCQKE